MDKLYYNSFFIIIQKKTNKKLLKSQKNYTQKQ